MAGAISLYCTLRDSGVNRLEWQQLAERWLEDAQNLLEKDRWSAAYYVAGYAVECGLKACVLARVGGTPEVAIEDRDFSRNCWTHSARKLLRQANLEGRREAEGKANLDLGNNWGVVEAWSENARYQNHPRALAETLYAAIANNPNGVMQWIRAHW